MQPAIVSTPKTTAAPAPPCTLAPYEIELLSECSAMVEKIVPVIS